MGEKQETTKYSIQPDSLVQRAKEITFDWLDDELLALDAQSGLCYKLNETAGLVWDLIVEPLRVNAICARLRQEFDVGAEECLEQVSELLVDLSAVGLVKIS